MSQTDRQFAVNTVTGTGEVQVHNVEYSLNKTNQAKYLFL